jgi:hypothetical protein
MQLPQSLLRRLEKLADAEGTSLNGILRRLISEHGERHRSSPSRRTARREDVSFPLIPKEKTGPIMPVTGADLDEIFALDSLAPGR